MPKTKTIPPFFYVIYIATTPNKLWTALTSSQLSPKYFFGRIVDSEWKSGSTITYWTPAGEKDVTGEILELAPGRRLSFTFKRPQDSNKRSRPTVVTFDIKALGKIVRLRLAHEHLVSADVEINPDTFRGVNNSWPAILSNLKTVLETGKPFELPGNKK